MKKRFIWCMLGLLVAGGIQAQEENKSVAAEKTEKVYQAVEKMPEFPGGTKRLMSWLQQNIQYPKESLKQGKQGRVIITFVINKDGKAVEPSIVRSVDPYIDKEAIRLVHRMPKWEPGEEKGEPVRVKFTLPIQFRLQSPAERRR